ncbi:hypothetical protein Oscil6304_5004 [Oscillatoria acuminata PCC 6304]|uniref:Uncharacterized protein n=1 Tax=Oscillatoria acuminata PCC 6304 TaxID=56110 RepID=K9TQ25_9CYAN|nr:hypothetical protein Oscil6304_5004 [Oscillatoria acuminata PCC 6304]
MTWEASEASPLTGWVEIIAFSYQGHLNVGDNWASRITPPDESDCHDDLDSRYRGIPPLPTGLARVYKDEVMLIFGLFRILFGVKK